MKEPQVARLLEAMEHGHVPILSTVFDLSRRAVVLTGATGSIWPTVLRAYLEQGAHVAIPLRNEAKGAALRDSLGDLAGGPDPRVLMRAADPGDRAAMESFVEQVLRAWGRLDVAANLIGGYASADAATGDLAAYRTYWDQKVATIVTATTACLRPMRARGYGRVVNVASTAAPGSSSLGPSWDRDVLPPRGRSLRRPRHCSPRSPVPPARLASPARV